ncbi:translation protein SH3-like domain-containing protein [Daldinia caldariorum]|uniref:translation protein SH3-like domain-containing protein n=1 Tax=Daldinia caldariorum TaxID=326644 RepID=UPI0020083F9D|nr:translation protein SH3-like domain-containing protein [Daldinia caldariorum]KAI1467318.1 translation protein SH3-like domain-containing protein [Daldinia caldariorum]
MITQSARRPLSSWKAVLRRTRQQRNQQQQQQMPQLFRAMATEATPTASASTPPPPPPATAAPAVVKPSLYTRKTNNPHKPIRPVFAVYPRVPSAHKTYPSPLDTYHAQQVQRLDKTGARRALFSKANRDAAKPGDVLQVTTRRGGGEPFAGVCLSIRRAGVDTAILLRNHVAKVPVERWFKLFSPNVAGIEIVWRRPKRARRARLTYMRKPKHDMGNVDHLVEAWRRTRNVFTTKGRAKANAAGAQGAKR